MRAVLLASSLQNAPKIKRETRKKMLKKSELTRSNEESYGIQ